MTNYYIITTMQTNKKHPGTNQGAKI